MGEYLAIKNWQKYQSLRGKGRWIFDYTQQDDEPELAKLSFFQRAVYQEIRRYRGRSGKNMLYDHEFIACATSARLKDRPRIPQAVRELVACRLLIVTNQEVDSAKKPEKEIENEKEKEKETKPSPRSASADELFEKSYEQYPRHVGKPAAKKAWKAALGRRKTGITLEAAEDFIYQRVMQFAAVCERIHKPREYIPHMATWLNQDRFKDDPSEWAVTGAGNGRGTSKAEQRNADISETTRAVFDPGRHLHGDAPKGLPDKASA